MSKLVIVAFGSRGDVAPFTGLGAQLQQAGHDVAIAACAPYQQLVEDAGLEYRWLPFDPEAGAQSAAGRRYVEDGGSTRKLAGMLGEIREIMGNLGPAVAEAAKDADILVNSVLGGIFGYHVAEAMGIPSFGGYVTPLEPTGDFPPIMADLPSLGRRGNLALGRLTALGQRFYRESINELRRDFGLKPTTVRETLRRQREQRWPVLHGFSRHLLPRPKDWRPGLELAGFWWPHRDPDWQPAAELQAFLTDGPPPVYAGFGSLGNGRGGTPGEITVEALRKAKVRGVVSGFEADGDDMFPIGNTPFDWLFPRMRAVVHHAGAGTTAQGLAAGVPTVAIPGVVDQFLWATRLKALGLAPEAGKQKNLDPVRLAAAIRTVIDDPSYRDRTRRIGAAIAAEDSVQPVLDLVDKLRP